MLYISFSMRFFSHAPHFPSLMIHMSLFLFCLIACGIY
uniref:Uncharacterized protein n=1 Tax=Arundo donax TaxID=35708 RepID=A0A0A8YYW0_ARUDO